MPTTRRSSRLASSQETSPAKPDSPEVSAGAKRKSETGSSPAPKRGKKNAPKEQKTIEETMDVNQTEQNEEKSSVDKPKGNTSLESSTANEGQTTHATKEDAVGQEQKQETTVTQTDNREPQSSEKPEQPNGKRPESGEAANDSKALDEEDKKTENSHTQQTSEKHADEPPATPEKRAGPSSQTAAASNGDAVQDHARDEETPSSILEKGVIYFFFRGRVGIDNPSDVEDIARSYLVLRPLPHGAKLGDGPIGASENKCRLLALPKKVLPASGKDKFMTFVEKTHTSFPELKKSFLPADDYETKTAGTRHTPAVTPVAEGVYAITSTGRENHLAYMLTIPSEIGQVQRDVGLNEQGSFIVSCKNPQFPGPSYASLPRGPDFPKEILDEFRSLRWMPLQPKHLDYENTQFLLIGDSGGIDKAMNVPDEQKDAKEETPKEEMEKLEGEDEIRVKHLNGDDAIFADLGVSKKDYPQVPTTWND